MISNELIKNFFEEQFEDISPFFLYKDHQLLKENKFQEFIDGQISKSRKRFIFGIILAIASFILSLTYLWFYAETSDVVHIINGFFWLLMGATSLFWFTKQYFIIRSSMSLIQRMLSKTDTKSV